MPGVVMIHGMIGLISGLALGMIGLGGGAFLLPLLFMANMALPEALASILFVQLIPITLPAVWMFYKSGHLRVKESVIIALGSLIGVTMGSYAVTKGWVPMKLLYAMAAISLIGFGVWMFIKYVM